MEADILQHVPLSMHEAWRVTLPKYCSAAAIMLAPHPLIPGAPSRQWAFTICGMMT